MAELQVEGDEFVVELSGLEKAGALHGDVRVRLIVSTEDPDAVVAALTR